MRIIRANEVIPVDHPVFMIFGQPGIGKSTLGYSADKALVLDFDRGAHRAANRGDTLVIDSWADIEELMRGGAALEPYHTLVVDTVGRCLDVLTAHLAKQDPRKFPGGVPSLQGWGALKNTFRQWVSALRELGKDVLLISHDREDKDGDTRIVRPDIAGGSYAEVMKVADFVGYLQMSGKDRVLDFSPTDRWIGKNPAGWKPIKLPTVAKAKTVMADLFAQGRDALGGMSEEHSKAETQIQDWRAAIQAYTTPDEINRQIPIAQHLPPIVMSQVKALLVDRAKALGFTWDKKAQAFVAPAEAAAV